MKGNFLLRFSCFDSFYDSVIVILPESFFRKESVFYGVSHKKRQEIKDKLKERVQVDKQN